MIFLAMTKVRFRFLALAERSQVVHNSFRLRSRAVRAPPVIFSFLRRAPRAARHQLEINIIIV